MIRDRLDETKEVLSPAKVAARPINPLEVSSDEDEDEDEDEDDEIRKASGNPKTTGESSEDENSNLKSSSSILSRSSCTSSKTWGRRD